MGKAPLLALAGALAFVVLAGIAANVETPTIDEFAHVPAGCLHLQQARFDLYAKNPPLGKMALGLPPLMAGAVVPAFTLPQDGWTPWLYGYQFVSANRKSYFSLFHRARVVPMLLVLLTGWMLFAWARELFGATPAAVTTALFFLNPNVLAHGHLATLDVACMATVLAAVFALHRASRRPSTWKMLGAGAVWGIALLTKFSAVLLLPALLGAIVLHRGRAWRPAGKDFLLVLAGAWLTVNLGMGFEGSFRPLSSYHLVSSLGTKLAGALPGFTPVPLPADWVSGFDLQKQDTEKGEFGSYLFGRWSPDGWWHYNLVALAVKNPLPLLGLLLAAPWFWWRAEAGGRALAEIALPAAVLLLALMFGNRLDIGVRYLLPIFPFLFLLTAVIWWEKARWKPWVAGGVLASHLAVAVWLCPEHLRYFNVAVGGQRHGHEVLLDSNLDWGQDLYRVPEALERMGAKNAPLLLLYFGHVPPHLYGLRYTLPPATPGQGIYAVSLQFLFGGSYLALGPDFQMTPIDGQHAAWLRSHPPAAKLGSIWVFDTR